MPVTPIPTRVGTRRGFTSSSFFQPATSTTIVRTPSSRSTPQQLRSITSGRTVQPPRLSRQATRSPSGDACSRSSHGYSGWVLLAEILSTPSSLRMTTPNTGFRYRLQCRCRMVWSLSTVLQAFRDRQLGETFSARPFLITSLSRRLAS